MQIDDSLATCENKYLIHDAINININKYYYPQSVINKLKSINNLFQSPQSPPSLEKQRPRIAIIREEGSNGECEMASAFDMAGFDTYDVAMTDFIFSEKTNKNILENFVGIAFVGGFSYSDCLGSGQGWYLTIKNNKWINNQFMEFFNRKNTFSFGVCNGFQLMTLLGVFNNNNNNYNYESQKIHENISKRFESRWVNVSIEKSNSIMLKDMENLTMGIWCAHRNGNITHYPRELTASTPIKFAKNYYPHNPNGSINGITSICSPCGRHLGMMPHPERCFLNWQMPYNSYRNYDNNNDNYHNFEKEFSPWFLMFKNAYDWCINNN